jgi:hypothetical protein
MQGSAQPHRTYCCPQKKESILVARKEGRDCEVSKRGPKRVSARWTTDRDVTRRSGIATHVLWIQPRLIQMHE